MKRLLIKRLLFIPLGVFAYIVTLAAHHNPEWTEQVYSLLIYPALSTVVGFVPSLVFFSVTEWVVVLFILFCCGYVAFYLFKIIKGADRSAFTQNDDTSDSEPAEAKTLRSDTRIMIAYRGVVGAIAIFCVVYFAFTVLCGLNYYRYSFTYYTGYTLEQSSVDELEQLCLSLTKSMEGEREQITELDPYSFSQERFEDYALKSISATQALSEQYPVLYRSRYSLPKPVGMSEFLSDANIAGMYFPFTSESNINVSPPFFTLPATMTHELSHQCGFMREDESNFIAYLACKQTNDPLMRYSGFFSAFSHSISALSRVDPQRASEITSSLPEAIRNDINENNRFWRSHQGPVSEVSTNVNDAYLKSNNQTDGVQSYGRMVDLLLAEQRATTE